MGCPLTMNGVHHVYQGTICPCGFVLRIPPICVSIEVTDRSDILVSDGFNCDTVAGAILGLRRAADRLERGLSK